MTNETIKVLEDIKAEIEELYEKEYPIDHAWGQGLRYSIRIINKHIEDIERK